MVAALAVLCLGIVPRDAIAEVAPAASARGPSAAAQPQPIGADAAGIWYCFEYLNPQGEVEWICVDV